MKIEKLLQIICEDAQKQINIILMLITLIIQHPTITISTIIKKFQQTMGW